MNIVDSPRVSKVGELFFEFGTEFLGLYVTVAGWETDCTTAGGADEGSSKFGCQGHGFRGWGGVG